MLTHFAVPLLDIEIVDDDDPIGALLRWVLFILSSPSMAQEAAPQQGTAEEQEEEKKPPRFYWDNGLWFRARRAEFRVKTGEQAQNDTAGLNWYPTYPTRVTFNVVRASRETWKPVWIFQLRLQLAF